MLRAALWEENAVNACGICGAGTFPSIKEFTMDRRGAHSFCLTARRLNIILFGKRMAFIPLKGIQPKIRSTPLLANDKKKKKPFFRFVLSLWPFLDNASRRNNIYKTIKSSFHHFMYAIKDILS